MDADIWVARASASLAIFVSDCAPTVRVVRAGLVVAARRP